VLSQDIAIHAIHISITTPAALTAECKFVKPTHKNAEPLAVRR
jgi:hypothetical protein